MIEFLLQRGEGVFYVIVTGVLSWIGWSVKTRFVPREEHDKLALRVASLENAVVHMPSAKEINALRAQLSDVGSELRVFNQKQINTEEYMRRLQIQIDRIDVYLRDNKKSGGGGQ